jgi:serine/threonine protein kinase
VHPRIVQLHDVIEAKNSRDVYLVFEYIEFDLAGILKTCEL